MGRGGDHYSVRIGDLGGNASIMDPHQALVRQLSELAAVDYTGRVVVHMLSGEIKKVHLEGMVIDGAEQLYHLVPSMGEHGGQVQ